MSGIIGGAGSKSGIIIPKVPTFFAYKTGNTTSVEQGADSAGAQTIVAYEATSIDTHSGFTTGTSAKYTIPAGQGGFWKFSVKVMFSGGDSNFRGYQIMLYSGSTLLDENAQRFSDNDIGVPAGQINCIADVAAGSEIQVKCQTNTVNNVRPTIGYSFYAAGNTHMNNAQQRATTFNGFKLQ